MSRILQIRRGTNTQNNNFTGLNGEITMDTTNKTIRIHDGETLGGIALARHDEIENATFDINNVSSSFWQNLFNTYQTISVITHETDPETITVSGFMDKETEYDKIPFYVSAVLVCQSPDCGYSISDEVLAFGVGDYCRPMINTYLKNGYMHIRLFMANQNIWVCNKESGVKTNIDSAKWKIKFIVCY